MSRLDDPPLDETTPPVDEHQIQDLTPLDETTPPIDLMEKALDEVEAVTPEDRSGVEEGEAK